MELHAVCDYLDDFLRLADFDDVSLNGLQVEAGTQVRRLAVSVDASMAAIEAAARDGADLLLCHHGLLWAKPQPIRGVLGARVGALFGHGMSLYAAHLPLDAHAEVGNNAELARLLELGDTGPFGVYRGQTIGRVGSLAEPRDIGGLMAWLTKAVAPPIGAVLAGPPRTSRVAVVSGAAGDMVEQAADAGVDLLVTGEQDHAAAVFARDQGVHLVFLGHHATETHGVRALARHLEAHLELPWEAVGVSTGF